jgi:hypothetical protein
MVRLGADLVLIEIARQAVGRSWSLKIAGIYLVKAKAVGSAKAVVRPRSSLMNASECRARARPLKREFDGGGAEPAFLIFTKKTPLNSRRPETTVDLS